MGDGKYARVNGLEMYHEVHGAGEPLVMLHGAFGTTETWSGLLPALTPGHQVILVEQQGHGRTPDREGPLSYEGMADDTAALIHALGVGPVDVFGYSDGGNVGLGLAIRHPQLVRRLAVIGANAGPMADTYERETYTQFLSIEPETFNFPEIKDPYDRVAPDPRKWPTLVAKILDLGRDFKGYSPADIAGISAPTLIMLGDQEGIRLEHAVELRRAIPNAQLAIFPGADHFLLFSNPEKVLATLVPFLETATASG